VAGVLNQTADKILFPKVYPGEDANVQLGIYGAVVKIAMIMALITQAFRYAYEPFVFGSSHDKDSKDTYAKGMKYYIIFTLLAYLCVMGYISILRHFIHSDYWDPRIVPIVMAAELMMGIYFNLSFWYKLTDKTYWGAIFAGIGCAVLVAINVFLVPKYGYIACAWGGFAGYGISMVLSYLVEQKYYPIRYPMKEIGLYTLLAAVFRRHHLLQQVPELLARHPGEYPPYPRLLRLHRQEGPASGGDSGSRQVFQKIDFSIPPFGLHSK
jgi:hypothetical protein